MNIDVPPAKAHPSLPIAPVGVQCPLTSSLDELPDYYRTGSGILGFRPCWCTSPFPSPSTFLGVFPFTLLHLPLNLIRVYSLRLMYLHPSVGPSLTHFLGEFPGLGVWIDSGSRCCGPRGGAGVRMKQKSCFKFLYQQRYDQKKQLLASDKIPYNYLLGG